MNTIKYGWCILFLFVIDGQTLAQEEIIELQETIKHIPQNKEHLLQLVETAEQKKEYTHCGDFYRWAEYEEDERKKKKLDKQAVKFYKKAIKNGEVAAYHTMAYMYRTGRGVKMKDYVASLEHLQTAANKGYIPSLYTLGVLYMYTGKNLVKKDIEKAESIFIALGKEYSKDIHPPSTKLANNSIRKRAIQCLVDLYTNPKISHKGKKLSLKKAIEWCNVIEDHSLLEKVYDKLSDYEELKNWIGLYHSFIPGLRRNYDLSTVESVNYAIGQTRTYLSSMGRVRLYKIEKAIFNEFFKTDVGLVIRTHHQALKFFEGAKRYMLPKGQADRSLQNMFCVHAKVIEVALAKQYDPQNIFPYLEQIKERARTYSEIRYSEYEALQKRAFEPVNITIFSDETIQKVLSLIAQNSWKESESSRRIIIEGENTLWKNNKKVYLKNAQERWQKYRKKTQQLCFDKAQTRTFQKNKTKEKIYMSEELKFLIVPPYSILENAQSLQEEVLGLIELAHKLKLEYEPIKFETILFKAHNTLCYEAYQKNYTYKTDLECNADERYYQMKKSYYKGLLQRMGTNKLLQQEQEEITVFWKLLFSEERIGVSYDGDRHSFRNLWILLNEFVIQLTTDGHKIWLQQLEGESKKLLCRAIQISGKIRLHALVKQNAQYSIKWHAEHTSPNCVPVWSQEVKSRLPCFFPVSGNYNSENEYDTYSPLGYTEEHIKNESLVQLLKSLGAQKDERDKARKEQEKIQKEEEQKAQKIEEENQKRHSKFLATLKAGDCVTGYIYFDCKPPFISQKYFRIKVSGRLVSVTKNEYRDCFIKITSIKKIYLRSSNEWKKKGGFGYCDLTEWHFLDREYPVKKREILSLCY